MSILCQCSNNHQLKVKNELAGKKIKCPKCQVVISVPRPTEELIEAELVDGPNAATEPDLPAKPRPSKHPQSGSPPATAEKNLNFQSLDFDLPPAMPVPLAPAATVNAYSAPSQTMPQPSAEFGAMAKRTLLLYGGTSTIASFAIVVLSGLLFFSGSSAPRDVAMAQSPSTVDDTKSPSGPPTNNVNNTTEAPQPSSVSPDNAASKTTAASKSETSPSAAKPTGTAEKSLEPSGTPSPTELRQVLKTEAFQGYVVPDSVCASQYDSADGRYYLGSNSQGVLVYNMADLVAGKLAPEQILGLEGGKPLAICLSTIGKEQFLLVSVEGSNQLYVFSTKDWQARPRLSIPDVGTIVDMVSSPRAEDATLFLSATNIVSQRSAALLHSYNFSTRKTTKQVNLQTTTLSTSNDGRFLAAYGNYMVNLFEWDGAYLQSLTGFQSSPEDGAFAGDRFVDDRNLRTIDGSYIVKQLPGMDFVESRREPVGACWSDTDVYFLSTNNYGTLTSVKIPDEWSKYPETPAKGEYYLKHSFRQLFFDEKLRVVFGRKHDKLLLFNYGQLNLPKEPDLRPATPLPATIEIGQQMVGSLGLPTGVSLKHLPTLDGIQPSQEDVPATPIVGAPAPVPVTLPNSTIVKLDNAASAVPLTKEDKVAWKPGKFTAGGHLLRLEATLESAKRELFQHVKVTFPSVTVPFQIFGLKCDRDSETALAWGYAAGDNAGKGAWKIAILDLTRQQPMRTADIPTRIYCGCLDTNNVYLCIDGKDRGNNPLPPYVAGPSQPNSANVQLATYSLGTLKEGRKTPLRAAASHMESIAGKQLILDQRQPISLPDMSAKQNINFRSSPLHGRVGGGWLNDGVLYSKDLKKPLLYVYPPKFAESGNVEQRPFQSTTDQATAGWSREALGGPQFQMWFHGHLDDGNLGEPISNFPGLLRVVNGVLELRVWPPSNFNPSIGNDLQVTSKTHVFEAGDLGRTNQAIYPITVSNQFAAFGAYERVWIAPLAGILPTVDSFQMLQTQDKFVLNAHKSTTVVYRAKNAKSFELSIQYADPSATMNERISMTSRDGKFNIEFNSDEVTKLALATLKRSLNANKIGQSEIKRYMQDHDKEVEQIADRKVNGVTIPVFAIASAIHEDGQQRCLMTHCYLVEVSPNAILKIAQGNP